MISKVLFLVLVGCAFVLAKPVDENTAVAEIEQPKVGVVEISEEEAKEIFKQLQDKFKGIWGKITKPFGPQDFENVFDEINDIFDKIFDEHKHQQQQESVESVESVESHKSVEKVESTESQKSVESKETVEVQE